VCEYIQIECCDGSISNQPTRYSMMAWW